MFLHRIAKVRAPEFPSGLIWLNTPPLNMRSLIGRPVLIDFWTYSCINCQHTLPRLAAWYERYQKLGLTIIGVHTPEFAFEKDRANVEQAIKEAKIPYAVLMDNDYAVWQSYANHAWPHSYLVNKDGIVVYDHVGEGGYAATELAIQKALLEAGAKKLPDLSSDDSPSGAACYRTTPETYLGYLRGRYGNAEEFLPDAEEAFTDAGEHEDDVPHLHGHFKVAGEYLEHTKTLAVPNEYLLLKYSSFGVNIVAESLSGKAKIIVELDGLPLSDDMCGPDIDCAKDGTTSVTISTAKMYRLVVSETYHRGTLKLKIASPGVRFYALTFESCG